MKKEKKHQKSMNFDKIRFFTITVVVIAVSLIASFPNFLLANEKTIKIGILEPLSGPLATIGGFELDSYRLAAEDINRAGGIKSLGGAKLELVVADTECKAEVGMSQVERLDREGVTVIIGAFQSGVTIPTTQVAEMKRIPYLVPISVADKITQRGFKYTFRACSTSSGAIERQAEFVYEHVGSIRSDMPIKTVGLFYENSAFGQTNAKYQKEMAKKYGKEIIADISYPSKSADVTAEVAKLKAANPDAVLRSSYASDAILITKTMIELRYNPKFWLGFSGVSGGSYIKALGKYVDDTIFMSPFSPKVPGAGEFLARFQKKYN
ncbi:MAG: ABC transporter substrate-binding protein, partial [Anaerolineales bacterium]|nr:ABC transporter substrate-binding protein [Anaerolineales bacterium]